MPRPMTAAESVTIAVAPSVVYAAISDPTQTGRWSPENLGATLDAPGTLDVGQTFVGRNKRRGFRWVTRCRVTAADPDEHFAFRVEAIGMRTPRIKAKIASWDYRLEPVDGGTRVTETWTDGRTDWSDRSTRVFDKLANGSTFHEFNTRNIRKTLDNLKATLESA